MYEGCLEVALEHPQGVVASGRELGEKFRLGGGDLVRGVVPISQYEALLNEALILKALEPVRLGYFLTGMRYELCEPRGFEAFVKFLHLGSYQVAAPDI
jgi:hypothetical protein